jgi:hypothetical protein
MTSFGGDPLDKLAPPALWEPDWRDVLARSRGSRSWATRRFPRRPVTVALAAVAVIVVPLVAYAAATDWWFLRTGPTPVSAPMIVKEGDWAGRPWQLIAYPSTTDGVCFAVTPQSSPQTGQGAAMSCAPVVGVARTGATKATPNMTITFLSGGATSELPAYIAGPVVDTASKVVIRFKDKTSLRVPTFPGPSSLAHIRFYATQLTAEADQLESLAGLDSDGNIVACLVPATAVDGVSPLSDCQQ